MLLLLGGLGVALLARHADRHISERSLPDQFGQVFAVAHIEVFGLAQEHGHLAKVRRAAIGEKSAQLGRPVRAVANGIGRHRRVNPISASDPQDGADEVIAAHIGRGGWLLALRLQVRPALLKVGFAVVVGCLWSLRATQRRLWCVSGGFVGGNGGRFAFRDKRASDRLDYVWLPLKQVHFCAVFVGLRNGF